MADATALVDMRAGLDPKGERAGARRRPQTLSAVAWRARDDMPFSDWVEQGRKLGQIGRSAGWWIGDWLNYGNAAYGERYVRAARITGYDVQTLMNMTYVASRFEPCRRRERLSWSHHAELAALEVKTQDRFLQRAETERLSVRDLRAEIRRERRSHELPDGEAGTTEPCAADSVPESAERGVVCPECGHSFAPAGRRHSSRLARLPAVAATMH